MGASSTWNRATSARSHRSPSQAVVALVTAYAIAALLRGGSPISAVLPGPLGEGCYACPLPLGSTPGRAACRGDPESVACCAGEPAGQGEDVLGEFGWVEDLEFGA